MEKYIRKNLRMKVPEGDPGQTSGEAVEGSFDARQIVLDRLPSLSGLLPSMWIEGGEGVFGREVEKRHSDFGSSHCSAGQETVLQGSG